MSLVEFTCLTLGLLNGVFLAIMPRTSDPNPSLFRLFGLGTVLSAVLVFLAAAAVQENFVRTTLLTVGLGLAGFFLSKPLCAVSTEAQVESQGANQELGNGIKQQDRQAQRAA